MEIGHKAGHFCTDYIKRNESSHRFNYIVEVVCGRCGKPMASYLGGRR